MTALHDQRASVSSSAISGARSPILAPRQMEALRHRALGLTVAATAAQMGITEKSLKTSMDEGLPPPRCVVPGGCPASGRLVASAMSKPVRFALGVLLSAVLLLTFLYAVTPGLTP